MSYNGSGTFNINSAGQPVVTGTVISSTAFNALTADLGTGLSTALTKDGQTVATARIPFAAGINSSLVTDATNTTTGSIITAGGVGIAKAVFVGTTLNVAGASTLAGITGSFNGTVGATTPAAGAFTTGAFSGQVTSTVGSNGTVTYSLNATTGYLRHVIGNNSTNIAQFGVEGSTGGQLLIGSTAYDTILFGTNALSLSGSGTAVHLRISNPGAVTIPGTLAAGATTVTGTLSATGITTVAAGSAALPAIVSTTGTADTGLWFPAADTVAASTAGAERMRIDSSGNLGIGTTSPGSRLQVSGSANMAYFYDGSTSDFQIQTVSSRTEIGPTTNTPLSFKTNNTERARIDSSGNLLVGATSAVLSGKITTSFAGNTINGATFDDTGNGNGAGFIIFSESGTAIGNISRVGTTSVVAYNTTSDYRLKTVTGTVTGQGARIDALKPIDYQWKDGNVPARGFLAHEFKTVYPNSVSGDKDAVAADGKPMYQSMQASTSEVIADLVAELQSLRKRITALEAK